MTQPTTSDYVIIFDGGSRGNPGPGYGSYIIRTRDGREDRCRLNFEEKMTNNEAEYRTLIAALDDLIDRIQKAGKDPSAFALEVRGDSQLIIAQLRGTFRVRAPHLRPLQEAAHERLSRFRKVRLVWQPRAVSASELGH
ncbi:ribonuclease HI family protein [Thermoflexus sp.]|uniref:ribonuclease HI family protein n=1 Tax=Thermoflexus sp. TaxID=1969742 RepID=UPI002ADE622B|nr:ribonuclease HI family protein [Thermoflexus sp.]